VGELIEVSKEKLNYVKEHIEKKILCQQTPIYNLISGNAIIPGSS